MNSLRWGKWLFILDQHIYSECCLVLQLDWIIAQVRLWSEYRFYLAQYQRHQGNAIYTPFYIDYIYFCNHTDWNYFRNPSFVKHFPKTSNNCVWVVIDCDPDSVFSIPLQSLHPELSVNILTATQITRNSGLPMPAPPLPMVVVSIHHRVDAAVEDSGKVEEVLNPARNWGCRLLWDCVPVKKTYEMFYSSLRIEAIKGFKNSFPDLEEFC